MPTVLQRAAIAPATVGLLSKFGVSGFLGGFDIWAGTNLPLHYGGPSLANGVDGYSMDTQLATATYGQMNWNTATDKLQAEFWFVPFKLPDTGFGNNPMTFLRLYNTANAVVWFDLGYNSAGNLRQTIWQDATYGGGGNIAGAPLLIPGHRYRGIVAVLGIASANWRLQVRWQDLTTGGALTTLYTSSISAITAGKPIDAIRFGAGIATAVSGLARIGGIVKSSLAATDFSDVGFDPAVYVPPANTRRDIYVDDAGNDANDGTLGHPILTMGELVARAKYALLFPATTPVVDNLGVAIAEGALTRRQLDSGVQNGTVLFNGDRLHLNVVDGVMTENINFNSADGLSILGGSSKVRSSKILTTFTVQSGIVWKTTDTQASVGMWENQRPMAHPTQGTITSGAAITYLQANPGSFWTDGVTMYLSAGDSGNPNTNGRAYERSYLYNNSAGAPDVDAVVMGYAHSFYIENLTFDAYTIVMNSDGAPVHGRGQLADQPGAHGYFYGKNLVFSRWSRHGYSLGDAVGNSVGVLRGWRLKNGGPPTQYFGFGQQTALVLNPDAAKGSNRDFLFADGKVHATEGVIPSVAGTAEGIVNTNQPVLLTHTSAVDEPTDFVALEFDNIDFGGGTMSFQQKTAASRIMNDIRNLVTVTISFAPSTFSLDSSDPPVPVGPRLRT